MSRSTSVFRIQVILYNIRFYNETICQIGTPYINEKFTVNDLRENIDDERLVELFKKILEAERHAQTQKCYFTPCGIIPQSSDPFLNNQKNQEGDSSSSIVMIDTFILILHILLLVMAWNKRWKKQIFYNSRMPWSFFAKCRKSIRLVFTGHQYRY